MSIDRHLGDPMYDALTDFIVSMLSESFDSVVAWSVQLGDTRIRQFLLRFTDGRSVEGYLCQRKDGKYVVHSFRFGFLATSDVQSVTFSITLNP